MIYPRSCPAKLLGQQILRCNTCLDSSIRSVGLGPLIWTTNSNSKNPNFRHGSSVSSAREARFLKKIYTGSQKKKWFKPSNIETTKQLKEMELFRSSSSTNTKSAIDSAKASYGNLSRRAGVLNTVFLQHITGLLATGEVGYELIGRKIEFTHVKLSPNLAHILIYWVTTEPAESEAELQQIFQKIAPKLRFECSKVRLIGAIPPIVFVKDTELSKLAEVEDILTKLRLKGEFNLNTLENPTLPVTPVENQNSKTGISEKLHKELEIQENPEYVSEAAKFKVHYETPEGMRQDILGLNHARIMEGIIQAKLRMATKKTSSTTQSRILSASASEDNLPADFDDHRKQKERQIQFLNYIKKRRIEKDKMSKLETTSAYNRDFDLEERYNRGILTMNMKVMEIIGDQDFEKDIEEDDYIDIDDEDSR